ncbi:Drmip_Hesp domain-containing protein, Developmentally Regulated MAPK Interacting Protein involved in both fruiting body formation [Histoplasma capsulatum]|uniref:Drmip_Hesp domain-containing protein, Developmentally Regulated MAPK Interacting Protein involved in both fruiting body formation n=1 Tax=Ajellomyces capsulatus TaxID=5037 RepID=A0A8A1MGP7_AJECA|nr:predicted protein [Histoplasma mississippiense (nom. inval.)]EDN06113.1 predicted protein [Histoplasma mississippiense (nom. inval.)]QSS65646.1 Drmip_Hesp domain-containing protein, Developmentally Regulated MAPK Interacting Protein involved in both fruiting body formation [Histoplasma capsulatum]
MRSIIYLAISAFAAVVAAQANNPFNVPPGGYSPVAGQPLTLSWKPTTKGLVTLKLQLGDNVTPDDGIVLASSIPNDGSFVVILPTSLGPGTDYNFQIIDDSDPSNFNFSPKFSISGTTGTATVLTPTATRTTASTTSTESTSATTTQTESSTTLTTSASSTTESTSSSTPTATPTATSTGETNPAPNPNSAVSLTRPGFMLSAVLGLMAFL